MVAEASSAVVELGLQCNFLFAYPFVWLPAMVAEAAPAVGDLRVVM
jgi:hypothetical protein